jgi:hypothetical protein
MNGGKNNRVFIVRQDSRIIGVLKQYYHSRDDLRDRLNTEWKFSTFLWNHGIHQIPGPVVSDPAGHLALYHFIEGCKLTPERVTRSHIDQAVDFYLSLNSFRESEEAARLPAASEACFSFADHIRLIDNRVRNLKNIQDRSAADALALEFINQELYPVWESLKCRTQKFFDGSRIPFDQEIPPAHRRLSPSDFGFHNAIEDTSGRLFFLDFEYAGWDDPAKMVCDFFCQPEIPVPSRFFSHIIERITAELIEPDIQRKRIDLLFPLYQIKWCCIVLNEFLPQGRSRRVFTDTSRDFESVKEGQLQKARNIITLVSRNL